MSMACSSSRVTCCLQGEGGHVNGLLLQPGHLLPAACGGGHVKRWCQGKVVPEHMASMTDEP